MTHQPRTASNRQNPPAMIKATAPQRLFEHTSTPLMTSEIPTAPRNHRPRESMFREKNLFTANV